AFRSHQPDRQRGLSNLERPHPRRKSMRWIQQMRMRFQMLFHRGTAAARLDDELQDHLERQVTENLAAGMNAEDARYAALRTFGNPALLREQARSTWSWTWAESLVSDVRYCIRTLLRTPGFAAI